MSGDNVLRMPLDPATIPGAETLGRRACQIGVVTARRLFRERGNHAEVHLTERELAALIALGAHLAQTDEVRR